MPKNFRHPAVRRRYPQRRSRNSNAAIHLRAAELVRRLVQEIGAAEQKDRGVARFVIFTSTLKSSGLHRLAPTGTAGPDRDILEHSRAPQPQAIETIAFNFHETRLAPRYGTNRSLSRSQRFSRTCSQCLVVSRTRLSLHGSITIIFQFIQRDHKAVQGMYPLPRVQYATG